MKRSPVKREVKWKKKHILDRIKYLEDGIAKCREYLESGKHGDWSRFRPLFTKKSRGEKELPPHPDWVKNWILPNLQRALRKTEKDLERLTRINDLTFKLILQRSRMTGTGTCWVRQLGRSARRFETIRFKLLAL